MPLNIIERRHLLIIAVGTPVGLLPCRGYLAPISTRNNRFSRARSFPSSRARSSPSWYRRQHS